MPAAWRVYPSSAEGAQWRGLAHASVLQGCNGYTIYSQCYLGTVIHGHGFHISDDAKLQKGPLCPLSRVDTSSYRAIVAQMEENMTNDMDTGVLEGAERT